MSQYVSQTITKKINEDVSFEDSVLTLARWTFWQLVSDDKQNWFGFCPFLWHSLSEEIWLSLQAFRQTDCCLFVISAEREKCFIKLRCPSMLKAEKSVVAFFYAFCIFYSESIQTVITPVKKNLMNTKWTSKTTCLQLVNDLRLRWDSPTTWNSPVQFILWSAFLSSIKYYRDEQPRTFF